MIDSHDSDAIIRLILSVDTCIHHAGDKLLPAAGRIERDIDIPMSAVGVIHPRHKPQRQRRLTVRHHRIGARPAAEHVHLACAGQIGFPPDAAGLARLAAYPEMPVRGKAVPGMFFGIVVPSKRKPAAVIRKCGVGHQVDVVGYLSLFNLQPIVPDRADPVLYSHPHLHSAGARHREGDALSRPAGVPAGNRLRRRGQTTPEIYLHLGSAVRILAVSGKIGLYICRKGIGPRFQDHFPAGIDEHPARSIQIVDAAPMGRTVYKPGGVIRPVGVRSGRRRPLDISAGPEIAQEIECIINRGLLEIRLKLEFVPHGGGYARLTEILGRGSHFVKMRIALVVRDVGHPAVHVEIVAEVPSPAVGDTGMPRLCIIKRQLLPDAAVRPVFRQGGYPARGIVGDAEPFAVHILEGAQASRGIFILHPFPVRVRNARQLIPGIIAERYLPVCGIEHP